MTKVIISEKMKQITDYWNPRLAGMINSHAVKLVKFKGEFDWHHHDLEDEFFFVVKGEFNMEFRDRIETIKTGEFIIVPKTIEHRPSAEKEVEVMLIEPETTINTGNIQSEKTVTHIKRI